MTRNMTIAFLALGIVLGCARSAAADTIHVPGDYATIQAAIDAADSGDEVVIAEGLWTGPGNKNLDFGGKDVVVRSASGDPESCVIDCEQDGRGFFFHSGESPDAIVEGLTIRNGLPSLDLPGGGSGGAIYCSGSDPTLRACVITMNRTLDGWCWEGCGWGSGDGAGHDGGGIYCVDSALTIMDCVISFNEAGDGAFCAEDGCEAGRGGSGGGICCDSSTITLIDCQLLSNQAGDGGGSIANPGDGGRGGNGGGICVRYSGGLTVIASELVGNSAGQAGGAGGGAAGTGGDGGGAFLDGAAGSQFVNCVISDNAAGHAGGEGAWGGSGGGIYGGVEAVNCVFAGNSAGSAWGLWPQGGSGGGICGGSVEAVNCFFTGNGAGSGTPDDCDWDGHGQGGAAFFYGSNSAMTNCTVVANASAYDDCLGQPVGCGGVCGSGTIDNCILWQNEVEQLTGSLLVQHSCIQGGWGGAGSNNIDLDPLLDGAHLVPGSPCIDAGDNALVPPDEFDLDGDGDTLEPSPFDLDGNPRFVDDPNTPDSGAGTPPIVDMGAYEYQPPCPADLTGDGVVDVNDLLLVLGAWGTPGGDVTSDGTTDVNDLLEVIGAWGPCA